MTDHLEHPDSALGESTPNAPAPLLAGGVFGDPDGPHDPGAHEAVRSWTIDEVLAMAKLPQRRARVCLRADLEAVHAELVAELSLLVNVQGEVIDDGETPLGAESNTAKALRLSEELRAVELAQAESMWLPLFEGLPPEELTEFNKLHLPKGKDPDLTEYQILLVARCAVDDDITPDKVRQLRSTLGDHAYTTLVRTALYVNNRGGVDAGKSPSFLRDLKPQ